ncbi:MAG: phosphotransferase family protein, partial [Proteobacteria bacterium]|nr:phosphotransferase family protein [Pseudomonadota bacterium]
MQWGCSPAQGGCCGLTWTARGSSRETAVGLYEAQTSGRVGRLAWLFSCDLFRPAAICQGIRGRVRDGARRQPGALGMAARVEPLSEAPWSCARRAGA